MPPTITSSTDLRAAARRAHAAGPVHGAAGRLFRLHRLAHYTATSPTHFQNFVLFTNYQFYIDEFCLFARKLMAEGGGGYTSFVEPGNLVTKAGDQAASDAPSVRLRRCRPIT